MQFEWDENKALRNDRFLSIGRSINGRLLVVSYTERYDDHIRIISAREATKQEEQQYEN